MKPNVGQRNWLASEFQVIVDDDLQAILYSKDFSIAATDDRQIVRWIANARHFPIDNSNRCVLMTDGWPVAKQVLRKQVAVQNATAIIGRILCGDPLANLIGQRKRPQNVFCSKGTGRQSPWPMPKRQRVAEVS